MPLKVIGESWALDRIKFDYTHLNDFLSSILGRLPSVLRRSQILRAGALILARRRFDVLAIVHSSTLAKYSILLFGIFGIKKLVLFETIIRNAGNRESLRMIILGWLLRRSCRCMHVMVDSDVLAYRQIFKLVNQDIRFIPWPMVTGDKYSAQEPLPMTERRHVLSSGRANCDWQTLLAAARGQNWPLVIVCSADDLSYVKTYSEDSNVTVLSEISREHHERLVKTARLYILCLKQANVSSGQIRLSHCSEFRTPMVASDVYGLRGYLEDGVTGIAVPPSDPAALRATVNSLLANECRLEEIVRSSAAYGDGKTMTQYAHGLARLIDQEWHSGKNQPDTEYRSSVNA